MEKTYLTIPEYARIKGLTPAAVYKQLDKRLKDYFFIDENGRKALKIEILADEGLTLDTTAATDGNNAETMPKQLHDNTGIQLATVEMQKQLAVDAALLAAKDEKIALLEAEIERISREKEDWKVMAARQTENLQHTQKLLEEAKTVPYSPIPEADETTQKKRWFGGRFFGHKES